MKIFISILVFMLSGCGTFGLKNIRQSEASLGYAQQIFARMNYKSVLLKVNPQPTDVKSIGPVRLYSSTNEPFSVDQSGWNYIQSIRLGNGNECYAYLLVEPDGSKSFKHTPGSLFCFQNDNSFIKMPL